MIEFEYKRDLNHNYLILSQECREADELHKKMLLNNKIYGLIPCSVRYVDEKEKYYYEISSKQTMEQVYTVKKMSYEELKQFFIQLQTITKELEKYLLDSGRLILDLKHIYWDLGKEQICLVYFPHERGELREKTVRLAEELIERTDHKDERAVNIVYRFYEQAGEDNFSFQSWTEYLEQDRSEKEKLPREELQFRDEQEERENEAQEAPIQKYDEAPYVFRQTDEEKEEEKPDTVKMLLFTAAVTAAAAGGFLYLFRTFILTSAEIVILGGAITAAVCGISFILWKRKEGKGPARQQEETAEAAPVFRTEQRVEERGPQDGETVCLAVSGWEQERCLEGRVRGRELTIPIDSCPFVLGKLEERVSYVLSDVSVSRLHAEFTEEKGVLYLRDLNSRNGTFKNGLRLEGDEKAEVRPGDEIKIGRLLFIYH